MTKEDYATITVKKGLYKIFKEFCNKNGYNVSKLICILMEEKLKKENYIKKE
jgi:hypothetical protein